jgi:poly(hydroxyalkanoate) granule-associated protein
MAKKLKQLADNGGGTDFGEMVQESAHQIWLAGLGAFVKAQEEGGKLFNALVKEGEGVQKRTQHSAEMKIDEVRAMAVGTLDKLEKVFEDRVARALHSLNVPTKKDIDSLSKRIAALTEVADKLSASMERQRR